MTTRGKNEAFLARQKLGLPKTGAIVRASNGRMLSLEGERRKRLRDELGRMLEDPEYKPSNPYLASVFDRLMAGVGGQLEIYLWRMVIGDPRKSDDEESEREREFEALRAELRLFLKENADKARAIGAVVTRAPRVLALPPLKDSGVAQVGVRDIREPQPADGKPRDPGEATFRLPRIEDDGTS